LIVSWEGQLQRHKKKLKHSAKVLGMSSWYEEDRHSWSLSHCHGAIVQRMQVRQYEILLKDAD